MLNNTFKADLSNSTFKIVFDSVFKMRNRLYLITMRKYQYNQSIKNFIVEIISLSKNYKTFNEINFFSI